MKKKLFLIVGILISLACFISGYAAWTINNASRSYISAEGYNIISLDDEIGIKKTQAFSYTESGFTDIDSSSTSYTSTFRVFFSVAAQEEPTNINISLNDEDNFISNYATITTKYYKKTGDNYTYQSDGTQDFVVENVTDSIDFCIEYTITSNQSQYSNIYSGLINGKKATISASVDGQSAWYFSKTISLLTKKYISIDWDYSSPFTYDSLNHTISIEGVNEEDINIDYSNNTYKNAGDYIATATLEYDDEKYLIDYNGTTLENGSVCSKNWSINKANLIITANNKEITYYDSIPSYDYEVEGLVAGETLNDINVNPVLSCDYNVGSSVGAYDILISEDNPLNYHIEYNDGVLVVNEKELGLSWDNNTLEFIYDKTSHHPTPIVTGVCGNDYIGLSVDGSEINANTENNPNYTATAEITNSNYKMPTDNSIEYVIQPKEVGISWTDLAFEYDKESHSPIATATGLIAGDEADISVSGARIRAGEDYIATAASISNTNYVLPSSNTTTFDITKRELIVVWGDTEVTYNGVSQIPTISASNICEGDIVNFTYGDGHIDAGDYTVSATAVSNTDYSLPSNSSTTFTINKANLSLEANDINIIYYDDIPTYEYTYTGLCSTDSIDTIATLCDYSKGDNVGEYDINLSNIVLAVGNISNYNVSYNSGVLTVDNADLTVEVNDFENIYTGSSITANPVKTAVSLNNQPIIWRYKYNGGSYSETMPSETNVNSYTIYYEVSAPNHNIIENSFEFDIYYLISFESGSHGSGTMDDVHLVDDSYTAVNEFTAENGYTFIGWSVTSGTANVNVEEITDITDNLVLTALWQANEYTITFVDYDETVISSHSYPHFTPASEIVIPADPTREADAQYTYVFSGWLPTITDVEGEAIYTAQYDSILRSYTITFVDYDDTVLQSTSINYGVMPVYEGTTPTKASTAQYTYEFTGWTPEVVSVTGEATYRATYDEILRTYTITIQVNNDSYGAISTNTINNISSGSIISIANNILTISGNSVTATPAIASARYVYSFVSWSVTNGEEISGDLTITATFAKTEREYNITVYFKDKDNQVSLVKTNTSTDATYSIQVYNFVSLHYNSELSGKKYGDEISLSKQILINKTYTAYSSGNAVTRYIYAYYVSPIDKLNWSLLDNVSGMSYQLMNSSNNYLISVDENSNMTIVVLCVQAEAIVSNSNTIDPSSSIYYPKLSDALEACKNVSTTTYMRIYGQNRYTSNTFMGACLTSNLSISGYSFSISGKSFTVSTYSIMYSDYSINSDYTIPSKLNVILPSSRTNSANSVEKSYNQTSTSSGVCTQISINGAIIINGSLTIGSYYRTAGINGSYSQVLLGSSGSLTVNGTLNAYGYIKEQNAVNSGNAYDNSVDLNRFIKVTSTGKVYTLMALYDALSGGGLGTAIQKGDTCPFWTYDFVCIQTFIEFEYGSIFVATAGLSIKYGTSTQDVEGDATIVSTSNSMFIVSNNSKVTFEYYSSTRTKITLYGNIALGSISISASLASIDSNNFFLPISYKLHVTIASGASFTVQKMVKFLNGSTLIVENNASLIVENQVIFYTVEATTRMGAVSSYNYSSHDTSDSTLINNGTIIVTGTNAKLGAFISHEVETPNGATLDFSNSSTSAMSVSSSEGTDGVVSVSSTGLFYSVDLDETITAKFAPANTYSSNYSNNNYYWEGSYVATAIVTIAVEECDYAYPIVDYAIYTNTQASNTNQVEKLKNQTVSQVLDDINYGSYVRIDAPRCANVAIKLNGTVQTYSSSTWYQLNGELEVTITPSSGTLVLLDSRGDYEKFPGITDSGSTDSGRGSASFKLSESTTPSGSTFVEVAYLNKDAGMAVGIIRTGYKFKYEFTHGTASNLSKTQNTGKYLYYTGTSGISNVLSTQTAYENNGFTVKTGGKDTLTVTATNTYYGYVLGFKQASGGICITSDTLITMFDGTRKMVKDLIPGDKLLVFNHLTGQFESGSFLYDFHDESHDYILKEVLHINFNNGNDIKIISQHRLYDSTINKYVDISIENIEEYINDNFVYYDDIDKCFKETTISSYEVIEEVTGSYSPVVPYYMNYIANGMLNGVGNFKALVNYFDYNDDLSYNIESMQQDIELYGLYDYEVFAEYVPYEIYEAFNGAYLKIAVEKGLCTFDEIIEQIREYVDFYLVSTQSN